MLNKSLHGKIIWPMVITLVVLVACMTIFSLMIVSRLSEQQTEDRMALTANSLQNALGHSWRVTEIAAEAVSKNLDVVQAISFKDTPELLEILSPLCDRYDIDFFIAYDETGTVLARTHLPQNFGDNLSALPILSNTLS